MKPTLTPRRRAIATRAGVADPDAAWALFVARYCPDYGCADNAATRHAGYHGVTDSRWIAYCGEVGNG